MDEPGIRGGPAGPLDLVRRLAAGLAGTRPMRGVVVALAGAHDGSAFLFDDDGRLLEGAGDAPHRLIWDAARRDGRRLDGEEVGRWVVDARPVAAEFGPVLALAVRSRPDRPDPIALETACAMLGALLEVERHGESLALREGTSLLELLADGLPEGRDHRYWPRLESHGFGAHAPFELIALGRPLASGPVSGEIPRLAESARIAGMPVLLARRAGAGADAGGIIAFAPSGPALEAWCAALGADRDLGRAAARAHLHEVPAAIREAELLARTARARGDARRAAGGAPGGEALAWESLSTVDWLLARADRRGLELRGRTLFAGVEADPVLRETLIAYLAADQRIGAAGEALFVHANTIRYRLGRIAELCGMPVQSSAFIANAQLRYAAEIGGRRAALERAEAARMGHG